MDTLILTCLNTRGFNVSNPPYLNDLLVKSDVLFLQEHWLSESQLSVFVILIQISWHMPYLASIAIIWYTEGHMVAVLCFRENLQIFILSESIVIAEESLPCN
jgi:hypothetical protein